ncbi:MAG: hypothetical protein HY282_06655 [Nitrospirae bacterium]|nr:hypothetical protein [Candidatus Manganitrophaceae bacterium]
MNRILLLIDHKENRRLLAEWLEPRHPVVVADSEAALGQPFDLGIVDGPALHRWVKEIQSRREADRPRFLPFLLIVPRHDVGLFKQHLWESIDELIINPVDKVELQVRVDVLLRSRQFSSELKVRNDELETYAQALTHDLRAPVRVISSFAKLLINEQPEKLNARGQHQLERIYSVAEQAWELIDSLLAFSRLGQKKIALRSVRLASLVESCLRNVEEEVEAAKGEVRVEGDLPAVQADPTLLKAALTNLLSNAVKYVAPGTRPRVTLSASVRVGICRIEIQDNGIGISSENLGRIFSPFVRLHSIEEYPGFGLGLSTVQKVIEIMGGRVGADSSEGIGSRFWIELEVAEPQERREAR